MPLACAPSHYGYTMLETKWHPCVYGATRCILGCLRGGKAAPAVQGAASLNNRVLWKSHLSKVWRVEFRKYEYEGVSNQKGLRAVVCCLSVSGNHHSAEQLNVAPDVPRGTPHTLSHWGTRTTEQVGTLCQAVGMMPCLSQQFCQLTLPYPT